MIVFIKLSIQLEHYLKKFRPPSWFHKVPRFIKLFHFFAGDTHLPALFLILYAQTGVKSLKTVNIIYFMLFDFSLLEFCFLSYKSLHLKTFFVGSLKDMNYVSEYNSTSVFIKMKHLLCYVFIYNNLLFKAQHIYKVEVVIFFKLYNYSHFECMLFSN